MLEDATRRGTPVARAGAIGVVGLVSVLSLTPNIAVPSSAPNHADLLGHLLMFGTLGFTLQYAWPRHGWLVLLALTILLFGLEFTQHVVPGRTFSFADLAANTFGAVLGVLLSGIRSPRTKQQK